MTPVFFVPNPAPLKAYTYCASVQLGSVDLAKGIAWGIQISGFQCDTKRIGANHFIDHRRADASLNPQN